MKFAVLPVSEYQRQSGERLRLAIEACDLKQVEAAKIMGISKSNLGNWIRGEAPIRAYPLYRFCRSAGRRLTGC